MAIKIQPLKLEKPKIKALIYGPPGVGKTTLLATINDHPEMSDLLIADVDHGLLSLGSRKGILTVPIKSVSDLEELQAMAAGKSDQLSGIQTIAIDSGTELYENFMREIALREHKNSPNSREMRDKNEIQDYGEATARLTRIFRWCRELPYHVIMTAHDKTDKRPVDTRKKSKHDAEILAVYPKFPEKLGTSIMGAFDYVWYLGVNKNGERVMLTQPTGKFAAKTRGNNFAPKLGAHVKDPNLAEIYQLLLDTETGE